jgi:predicted nucleotidyltransferase
MNAGHEHPWPAPSNPPVDLGTTHEHNVSANLNDQMILPMFSHDALRAELPQLDPFRPAAVYLFGSLSRGNGHGESDIDLAFLPARPCDPVEVFETANRLAGKLGRDVDLVDLSRASTVMRKEVLRTGVLFHESDRVRRMEFEMLALSDYARLNEERQPVLRKLSNPAV